MAEARIPTEIDAIAERWVDTLIELDPSVAVWIGATGEGLRLGEYGDQSPRDTPAGPTRRAARSQNSKRRVRSTRATT